MYLYHFFSRFFLSFFARRRVFSFPAVWSRCGRIYIFTRCETEANSQGLLVWFVLVCCCIGTKKILELHTKKGQ